MAYGLPGRHVLRRRPVGARDRAGAPRWPARWRSATCASSAPTSTALPALGEFDYVIAHGVYSWIAPAARDALLAACRGHLAPGGVAYVSYDVLPGGHLREITRQMLRWHLREVDEPRAADRAGRGRCWRPSPPPARRSDEMRRGRRARAAAERRGVLPRRARAAPRGRAVLRLRRPRRPPRPALPRRGRRVRDGRRPAAARARRRRDRARAVPRLLQGADVPADAAVPRRRRAARGRPGGRARDAGRDAGASTSATASSAARSARR